MIRSSKRKKEEREYRRICQEKRKKLIAQDNWVCFFSGQELPLMGPVSFHHLGGRQGVAPDGGNLYLYEPWIVPVLDDFHRAYHDCAVDHLNITWWYKPFLSRLRDVSEALYEKEIEKQTK